MSIIGKLASSLDRRDEVPNQELAKEIASKNDVKAVQELVVHLKNKNKKIQHDCIKVLYEIGTLQPKLISGYLEDFFALLESKNNRLQWGGMTAINTITFENSTAVYASLPKIIQAIEKGSVITKDNGVSILIKLCSLKQYAENAFPLLMEQLLICAINQLPMYAERTIPVINDLNKHLFTKTLTARLEDIEKDTKRKRIEKVIKKFS